MDMVRQSLLKPTASAYIPPARLTDCEWKFNSLLKIYKTGNTLALPPVCTYLVPFDKTCDPCIPLAHPPAP